MPALDTTASSWPKRSIVAVTARFAVAAAAGYVRTGQAFLEMDGPALEAAVRTMAATSSSAALLSETVSRLESARRRQLRKQVVDGPDMTHFADRDAPDFGKGRPDVVAKHRRQAVEILSQRPRRR